CVLEVLCASLANKAAELISNGNFKIFTLTPNHDFGGAAPIGGDWVIIGDWFLGYYEHTKSPQGVNLDAAMAHEMDHILNSRGPNIDDMGHVIGNPYHTLNSVACSAE